MSAPRNDDFAEIEKFRIKPQPPVQRKAVRLWSGAVKFAVASEEQAQRVADCIESNVANSAAWDVAVLGHTDNVITISGLRYQARSANSNDAEQLVARCILSQGADLLSPIAVQTHQSVKLTAGL